MMVGTMCALVVVSVVLCAVAGVLALSSSTRQTEEALDAAITAYDRYLQEISSGLKWTRELAVLDADGRLASSPERIAAGAGDSDIHAVEVARVRRLIGEYEDAQAESAATLFVYYPASGLLVGRGWSGALAGCPDERIASLDLTSILAEERDVSFQVVDAEGTHSMINLGEVYPGIVLLSMHGMPDLPGLEILSPIEDITELYFVDRYGHKYAYRGDSYAGALSFDALVAGGSSGESEEPDGADGPDGAESSGLLTLEYNGRSYRCYFHESSPGYNKFVLISPNVADEAFRGFAVSVGGVALVLVMLGCLAGVVLTRRIYAPVREIIQRLTPPDQDVRDEFKLIGFALSAMEKRLDDQAQTIAEYHLLRFLRGQADVAREGEGMFFAEGAPHPCVVLAVRPEEGGDAHAAHALEVLKERVGAFLGTESRDFCMCSDGGFLFAVLDAAGGGVLATAERMRRALEAQDGFLVSVFASDPHEGASGLARGYREVLDLIEQETAKGTFCQVVGYESFEARPASRRLGAGGAEDEAEAMREFVRANYRDPNLSAGMVARRFHMTQPRVSRLFKADGTGSFLDYVHGLRIAKAEELLREGTLSVADVATSVGYGNALTMTRAFKRYVGTTPGAYRGEAQAGRAVSTGATGATGEAGEGNVVSEGSVARAGSAASAWSAASAEADVG